MFEGVDPTSICNFATNKPLGASQVTAIVRSICEPKNSIGKTYSVSFFAELIQPFFVRLSSPRVLSTAEKAMLARATESGVEHTWRDVVAAIRKRGEKTRSRAQQNRELFAEASSTQFEFSL